MKETATIREWLDLARFDWLCGIIVYHETATDEDREYEMEPSPGWSERVGPGQVIPRDHPILDHMFRTGYGGPMCPRFIAQDGNAVYFPAQYDGSTWLEKVDLRMASYVGPNAIPTPYPGG
jgi:hypothetical protein